ncbi:pectate lyase [Bacteroides salyersiae]|uniref:pectate lyase n=1 Tax=Bacteroides salyersiae TaxID=291644 RepID=UPI00189A28F0|nr:pectate lyase [Bacteroides salyersiae]
MKLKVLFFLGMILFCHSLRSQDYDYPTVTQNILAFPSAEGFGKYATGGRGGEVVTVTTLEDDTLNLIPGSLRWAVQQFPDVPLTIVFNVSGHINLKKILTIRRTTGLTIAGQTAPGEGISINGHRVNFGFSENVIVRNVRFRVGDVDGAGRSVVGEQALGAENIKNFIFDHCSLGWSGEEASTTSDSEFLTLQYCIVHEGLFRAKHHKGDRSYGICFGGKQATMHHCLLAHNVARVPRFSGAQSGDYVSYCEYINNVCYNMLNGAHGGEINVANIKYHTYECNFVNNYYKPGPASIKSGRKMIFFNQTVDKPGGAMVIDTPHWYFNGNIMEGNEAMSKDNWKGVTQDDGGSKYYTLQDMRVDTFIQPQVFYRKMKFDWRAYTLALNDRIESAENALQTVLEKAGCIVRDSVERRLIRETRDGTATFGGVKFDNDPYGIIDSPSDLDGGIGYLPYPDYTPRIDTDGDGMPDDWEELKGLDPNNPADRNYVTTEGYTALEVYLCSLMGEDIEGDFQEPTSVRSLHTVKFDYSVEGDDLIINSDDFLNGIHIFDMEGCCRLEEQIIGNSYRKNISFLDSGVYIVWISNKDGYRNAVKIYKE